MTTLSTITTAASPSVKEPVSGGAAVYAIAYYELDTALASATKVNVSWTGVGGANVNDFLLSPPSTFEYHIGTLAGVATPLWQPATNNGPITLNAGFTEFQLRIGVKTDTLAETGEGVMFAVSQTASTVGITNSYFVPVTVDINDPQGVGASAFLRDITAGSPTTGVEPSTSGGTGTDAVANFIVTPLEGGTTADYAQTEVKVSITTGLGGSSTADYTQFWYAFDGSSTHSSVPNNNLITIPAAATTLQLGAVLKDDTKAEASEQLLFTVSQTAKSVGLVNSWGIQEVVDLQDAAGQGAMATPRTIVAGTVTAGVEGLSGGNGTPATAVYDLNAVGSGSSYADAVVKVGIMTGLGGSSTADYSAFSYTLVGGSHAGTSTVPATKLITIYGDTTSFSLSATLGPDDSIAEANEQLIFTVAQTSTDPSLTESWWVPSVVDLKDAAGTGATAQSRTITPALVSPAVTGVEGGTAAQANYALNNVGSGTGYADVQVRVGILAGLGGSSTVDYSAFSYTIVPTSGSATTSTVPATKLITIPSNAASFSLSATIGTDSNTEANEQLIFTVSNTGASPALTDSWYVPITVDLQDAQGTGAVAYPRHITADSTITGTEGSSTPASARFKVWYDGVDSSDPVAANYSGTQVQVSMFGAGGASSADYPSTAKLQWHTGTASGGWSDVPADGLITIPNSASYFELSMMVKDDGIAETGEGITFAVSQTAKSVGLSDSWWVTNTADIADVAAVYTVVTGLAGSDHFTATTDRDKFVIPANSSKAQAEQFDWISGTLDAGASHDLISVGGAVGTPVSLGSTSEATLLSLIGGGVSSGLAAFAVGYYSVSPDTYLIINTDGGTTFNANDTLIKIVGQTLSSGAITALFTPP